MGFWLLNTLNNKRLYFLFGIFLFLFSDRAGSAEIALLDTARIYFYKSVENKEKIEPAIQLFEQINKNEELEGLALTYIGALTALKGKFAFLPIEKLAYVRKGLTDMDVGVYKSPNNLEARFIRGQTCYYLPFFFKRKQTARTDFKKIVSLLEENYQNYSPELLKNVLDFLLENAGLEKNEIEIVRNVQKKLIQYAN